MIQTFLKLSTLSAILLALASCGSGESTDNTMGILNSSAKDSNKDMRDKQIVVILHNASQSECQSQSYYNKLTAGLPNMKDFLLKAYSNDAKCSDFGKKDGVTCQESQNNSARGNYACVFGANSGTASTSSTQESSSTSSYTTSSDIKAYNDAANSQRDTLYNYNLAIETEQFNSDVAWSNQLADEQYGYDLYQEQYGNYDNY